jgi:uncharacterized protein YggU (UPF0235/DUF167 family)
LSESRTGTGSEPPGDQLGPEAELLLEEHPQGAILPVRARAGGRSSMIQGVHAGELRISVTQVPEKGKANKVLTEILSAALGIPKSRIELISGQSNPRKRFLVHGLTPSELARRLKRASVGE